MRSFCLLCAFFLFTVWLMAWIFIGKPKTPTDWAAEHVLPIVTAFFLGASLREDA